MKKLGIHPLFLLIGLFFVFIGLWKIFLIYLLVVILHELAHALVAHKLGYKSNKIFLLPFGAGLTLNQANISSKDEMLIAVSGPLFNFVLALFTISFWWIEPAIYNYTQEFVLANIITGLVNFLPCYPLDGGRIFVAALSEKIPRRKALKFSFVFNYVFSAIFLIMFIISLFTMFNITYILMAIFIFFGCFESRFNSTLVLSNMPPFNNVYTLKKPQEVRTIAISAHQSLLQTLKALKKDKFNIVYIIFENGTTKALSQTLLEKMFICYPLNQTFEKIYCIKQ